MIDQNQVNDGAITQRRFGLDHDQPCKRPNVLTCATWQCQKANRCCWGEQLAETTGWPSEAAISIDGHSLTTAQSMTVRVALEVFAMTLTEHGDPEAGSTEHGYLRCIREIRALRSK